IHVLNPIRKVSIRRNEVKKTLPLNDAIRSAKKQNAKGIPVPLIDIEDDNVRTQRHAIFLKDVAYIIKARVVKVRGRHPEAKHRAIFLRRVRSGKCVHQPYLGTRECTAYFGPPEGNETPIPLTKDLGMMLHDMYFIGDGQAIPMFEPLRMENGIVRLPERKFNWALYEEADRA
ncbi:MAG: hypothetical protein K6T83_20110, partial [Alicyclobacillus sp.]|nr:hypothetical protein [Alicyclobacillus sp.]